MTQTMEEETDALYQAMGRSIAAWSGAELSLSMLFSVLATGQEGNTNAITIFHSVDAFRPRLLMITDLMSVNVRNADLCARWVSLEKSLKKRQSKRNFIAHANLMQFKDRGEGRQIGLIPPFMSPLNRQKLQSGKVQPLFVKDVLVAFDEFCTVADAVRNFFVDVKAHVTRPR